MSRKDPHILSQFLGLFLGIGLQRGHWGNEKGHWTYNMKEKLMGKWKTEWQLPLHELLTILSVGVGGYRGWSSLGLRIEESRAFLYAYATRPAHVYIFITLSALYMHIYIYISPIPIILNPTVFIPKLVRGAAKKQSYMRPWPTLP